MYYLALAGRSRRYQTRRIRDSAETIRHNNDYKWNVPPIAFRLITVWRQAWMRSSWPPPFSSPKTDESKIFRHQQQQLASDRHRSARPGRTRLMIVVSTNKRDFVCRRKYDPVDRRSFFNDFSTESTMSSNNQRTRRAAVLEKKKKHRVSCDVGTTVDQTSRRLSGVSIIHCVQHEKRDSMFIRLFHRLTYFDLWYLLINFMILVNWSSLISSLTWEVGSWRLIVSAHRLCFSMLRVWQLGIVNRW